MASVVSRSDADKSLSALFDPKGRVAPATGASSGLGLHCATLLSSAAVRVALATRRAKEVEVVAVQTSIDRDDPGIDRGVHLDVNQGDAGHAIAVVADKP